MKGPHETIRIGSFVNGLLYFFWRVEEVIISKSISCARDPHHGVVVREYGWDDSREKRIPAELVKAWDATIIVPWHVQNRALPFPGGRTSTLGSKTSLSSL